MDKMLQSILNRLDETGVSDTELEKKIGLPRSTIYDWRNNRSKSYYKHVDKIAKYFNVPTKFFVSDIEFGNINSDYLDCVIRAIKTYMPKQSEEMEVMNTFISNLEDAQKTNLTESEELKLGIHAATQILMRIRRTMGLTSEACDKLDLKLVELRKSKENIQKERATLEFDIIRLQQMEKSLCTIKNQMIKNFTPPTLTSLSTSLIKESRLVDKDNNFEHLMTNIEKLNLTDKTRLFLELASMLQK